jgi:SAM-dependent methyltransferase
MFVDRFDGRALNYSRYRPRYPRRILRLLELEAGLDQKSVVADVGSGTGILSELFLSHGNSVLSVEPNDEMRRIAETMLAKHGDRFASVKGTAESTSLPNNAVDLVAVGQALHWFEPEKARREFRRILRGRRPVCVVFNDRKSDGPVEVEYGRLVLEYAVDRGNTPEVDDPYLGRFLGNDQFKRFSIPNRQVLGYSGLLGRLASASYMPGPGSRSWDALTRDVSEVVRSLGVNGRVTLHYVTRVYIGHV